MTNFSINGTYLSLPELISHICSLESGEIVPCRVIQSIQEKVMYIDQECRLVRLKLNPCLVWCVMPIKRGTSGNCAALASF